MNKFKFSIVIAMVFFSLIGCSTDSKTNVAKGQEWKESPTLSIEMGTTGEEHIFHIGANGKMLVEENGPLVAGEGQKYMWHFWGEEETLTKPFKIKGISQETGEEIGVFNIVGQKLTPYNGATHHLPAGINLPKSGLWKLDAYFGDKLFGSVVVNVKEPN